jgi:ligand-binding sensor domain-containing protein
MLKFGDHQNYPVLRTLVILLLWLPVISQAQQSKEYVFTHFTTSNGLAAIHVNQILQDERGFMWLATINGLQRYDGLRFVTYRHQPSNPASIPSDNIVLMYHDRNKNLWISTDDNRIGIFNKSRELYEDIPIKWIKTTVNQVGKHLFETKAGLLILVMGDYGIYVFDTVSRAFVPKNDLVPVPRGWKLNSLQRDTIQNKYWISADSGLAMYNPATRKLNYRGHNPDNDPVINKFSFLKSNFGFETDGYHRFFVTVWMKDGPLTWFFLNTVTNDFFSSQINNQILNGRYYEINGQLFQRNGRIWVYGMPFITEFREKEKKFEPIRNAFTNEQSIRFDNARRMYEDRQHNIWICTDNGLFFFNPEAQLFNSYGLLRPGELTPREGPVQVVKQLRNGNVWVGCWGLGLFVYDKDLNPIPLPKGMQHADAAYSMWTICEQRSTGYIWIGMQAGEIMVYDPVKQRSYKFKPPEFEGRTIRQITEDKEGNLWMGSHGGHIIKWDLKSADKDPRKGFISVAKKGTVLKIICDTRGDIWVGTAGTGLFRIDAVKNTIVDEFNTSGKEKQRLWRESPMDLVELDDSLLLVANGAVDMINKYTRKVVHISSEDGLPSNNVVTIQKDNNGILWLGMTNGLCRFNFQMGIFTLYDRRDGIAYDNFLVAGSGKMNDGKLVFNNEHNFMVFDPSKMVRSAIPPNPLVTSIIIGGKQHPVDSLLKHKRIVLPYDNNSIEFGFSALNYMKQEKLHFHYQMKGIDKRFHESYDMANAVYNYLPPGDHTFVVSTENADGISSADVASIYIRVESAFWETWWFYGLILLAITAVLYWIDRERLKRLHTLQQVRSDIAGNLHKEVNTTLSNISLLTEMAKIKADKDIIRTKEYIDQINDKSRKMIVAMDDMLWSIEPGNDTMEKTIDRMKEFAEMLHRRTNIPIDFVVDQKVRKLQPGMKTRHELFMIFKESLHKSTYHTGCTLVSVSIDLVKSKLLLKIKDDGKLLHLSPVVADSIFADMKKRAASIKASIDIQFDHKSTSIILQVPVFT